MVWYATTTLASLSVVAVNVARRIPLFVDTNTLSTLRVMGLCGEVREAEGARPKKRNREERGRRRGLLIMLFLEGICRESENRSLEISTIQQSVRFFGPQTLPSQCLYEPAEISTLSQDRHSVC